MDTPTKTFTPLHVTARLLGLPESWVRAEAVAGRLPHIRVGRRLMFDFEAVERTLLDRAQRAAAPQEAASCA